MSTLFAPLELKDGTQSSGLSRDFGFYLPDLAIAASALLELSTYAGNGKAKRYMDYGPEGPA